MSVNQMVAFYLHDFDGDRELMPVQVRLSWSPADPVAIEATFHNGRSDRDDVVWIFSRDLLAAGILTRTGAGDVRVGPGVRGELRVSLTSNSGHADFSCRVSTVETFLQATFDQCPLGDEFVDTDVEHELWCLLLAEGS